MFIYSNSKFQITCKKRGLWNQDSLKHKKMQNLELADLKSGTYAQPISLSLSTEWFT